MFGKVHQSTQTDSEAEILELRRELIDSLDNCVSAIARVLTVEEQVLDISDFDMIGRFANIPINHPYFYCQVFNKTKSVLTSFKFRVQTLEAIKSRPFPFIFPEIESSESNPEFSEVD